MSENALPNWFARETTTPSGGPAFRATALTRARDLGVPTPKQEDWKYTNLDPIRGLDLQEAPAGAKIDWPRIEGLLPSGLDATRVVLIDGRYSAEHSDSETGAEILRLSDFVSGGKAPDQAIASLLTTVANFEEHSFAALNTARFADGVAIRVKRGVALERPIQIVSVVSGASPIIAYPRILVLAEESASATVIEQHFGCGGNSYLTVPVTEVSLGKNAQVDHYRVLHDGDNGHHISTLGVQQDRDSVFRTHCFTFGGALVRNEVNPVISGSGSICTMNGLSVGSGTQLIDNTTVIDHAVPHCESHELYKGIYTDKAKGVFSGTIIVRPQAQKTNAYQSNRAVLLSDTASSQSRPQLKIWADDVKCSHGATTGQLDEDALFYLRSRGIDRETARHILVHAFASEVINGVRPAALRAALEADLIGKLRSRFGIAEE